MIQQHMVANSPIVGGLVVLSMATSLWPPSSLHGENISKAGPIGGSYLGVLYGATTNWEILQ